jgi:hypothetical protein
MKQPWGMDCDQRLRLLLYVVFDPFQDFGLLPAPSLMSLATDHEGTRR